MKKRVLIFGSRYLAVFWYMLSWDKKNIPEEKVQSEDEKLTEIDKQKEAAKAEPEEAKSEEGQEATAAENKEQAEATGPAEQAPEGDRMQGKVKWFDEEKRFGFITGDDGKDYFVHKSSLPPGTALRENDPVSFVPTPTDRGIQAQQVEVL